MTGMEESAINLAILDFLCSAPAAPVLADLETRDLGDEQTLAVLGELRRDFRPEEAAALLSLARLRRRAAAKFPEAQCLFFHQLHQVRSLYALRKSRKIFDIRGEHELPAGHLLGLRFGSQNDR